MSSSVCRRVMCLPGFGSGHIPRIFVVRRKSMSRFAVTFKVFAFALVLLGLLTLGAGAAYGQAITGNVVGTVVDSSGAAVVNADLSVVNIATGVVLNGKTTETGGYRFDNLLPGSYKITVKSGGFRTTTV